MSKRTAFKSQASSSRASAVAGFGGFGLTSTASPLSYLGEPANLSGINDPNVVVAFKNMGKKDGTTVAKGIEYLRAYVGDHPHEKDGGVEDAVLEAWVSLLVQFCRAVLIDLQVTIYPRLSIDNSRRVRELSHLVLYDLLISVRKRIERHFPKIIGAWIAGLYDRDRSASAAAESTLMSFAKEDTQRVTRLKSAYQAAILEYAQTALKETLDTLSDERTMTREDMLEKFHRVISSSLNLIFTLLNSLEEDEISKEKERYEAIFSGELWTYISCDDSHVRTSAAQLLTMCVEKQPAIVEANLQLIGQNFIMESLRVSQLSSATLLLDALASLSRRYPQVWALKYKGKKAPPELLLKFVEQGPHGCNELYWKALSKFTKYCPKDIIFPDLGASNFFLEKLTTSITKRPLRVEQATAAWECCIDILELLLSWTPPGASSIKLCETAVFPILESWLFRTTGTRSNDNPLAMATSLRVYTICAGVQGEESNAVFAKFFQGLADRLNQQISTSLPQQSQDYVKSQDAVADTGRRWFRFLEATSQSAREEHCRYVLEPSYGILQNALSTIETRGGKPYSAAATVDTALSLGSHFWQKKMPAIFDQIKEFIQNHFITLSRSPSAPFMVSMLGRLGEDLKDDPLFNAQILWSGAINEVLQNPISNEKVKIVSDLITMKDDPSIPTAELNEKSYFVETISHAARNNSKLQDFFLEQARVYVLTLTPETWTLLETTLAFDALSSDSETKLVDLAMENMHANWTPQHATDGAYNLLGLLFRTKPMLLRTDDVVAALVWQMLRISETNQEASVLRNIVDSLCIGDGENQERDREESIVQAIHAGLDNANFSSLK
jgi:hypothetical protein